MLPVLRIPIDHCLVSSELVVLEHTVGPDIGSDHYPLLVTLAVR
jgi:endonuclease/exonuclease/phosphatase (EEP) superfamily protein YafD